jgi:predicted RNA-binding Zn ribbon-like protein
VRLAETFEVPVDLALVYEFVNSVDHRSFVYRGVRNAGGDELSDRAGLRAWLTDRQLLTGRSAVSAPDLDTARTLRAALREAIARHGAGSDATTTAGVFATLPLITAVDDHGRLPLRPAAAGAVATALSALLIQATTASATGRWQRLKMCNAVDCRWIFFDASKPANGRWCNTDIAPADPSP